MIAGSSVATKSKSYKIHVKTNGGPLPKPLRFDGINQFPAVPPPVIFLHKLGQYRLSSHMVTKRRLNKVTRKMEAYATVSEPIYRWEPTK